MSIHLDRSLETCHVLLEDGELAEAVPAKQRERAVHECVARSVHLYPGRWSAQGADRLRDGIGMLIVEGLLIRRVGVDERFGAELLGEGDLLRPWQGEEEPETLSVTTGWRVLQPTRIALLDEQFALRTAPYPRVGSRLVGRALARARNLAINMAIVHQARVDMRVQMLLWHLASRWGRVNASGVVLPLRLTHAVLADLVAARRPTVSSAVSDLARRDLVQSHGRGWLLKGEPPGELLRLSPVRVEQDEAIRWDPAQP
ncbi:MAG: helix-turn-helix domain-containing protein [Solirubrobacteraceae bacterium]